MAGARLEPASDAGPPAGRMMREAFLAGYEPQVAGLYFNGLQLLTEAARGADGRLAIQVGEERDRVVGVRDDALARLDATARHLAVLGAAPVPRPADAGAFAEWSDAVFDAVRATMAGDSPEAVAHLLGYVMGEAVATLDALAILARLWELAPDHLWMRLQGDSLERERATAQRRLGRLASHAALPEAAQVATARAAHAVAGAAASGTAAGRAGRAEVAAREVAEQAVVLEGLLGPGRDGLDRQGGN